MKLVVLFYPSKEGLCTVSSVQTSSITGNRAGKV